jgi:phosphatidylglycerol---prolipoprotein diacylglyceryl transferase
MIQFPEFDPIIFSIGPLAVRWYGLMYVVGIGGGWWLGRWRAAQPSSTWKAIDVDDLVFFAAMGLILGGRLGWVLFYGLEDIVHEPLRALKVWEGGMSFHGGILGGIAALALFAHRRGRALADVLDFTAPLPAIGLCTGRIANFINGELWGKPTDVPWAIIYHGVPRHPSQLYEAFLEGIVLFTVVFLFTRKPRPQWAPTGLWLMLYGVFRFSVEFVRVPDANRGYLLWGWVTEGQILCVPMVLIGGWLVWRAYSRKRPSGNYVPSSVIAG